MNIPSGAQPVVASKPRQLAQKTKEVTYTPAKSDSSLLEDGWVGTSLSLAGGAAALFGAVTDNPALAIGGMLTSSAGMTVTAYRTQMNGALDQAAKLSFVGGLGATAARWETEEWAQEHAPRCSVSAIRERCAVV